MSTLAIVGGDVLTADGTVTTADIVVDVDRGVIEAVVAPGATDADETLDATGGVVIPGLVNAHTHVAMTLLRGNADDKPLHAWLEEDIFPVEAELTPEDVAAGARLGMLEMIRGGTTTFCDMYFHEGAIADAAVEAGLRCRLGHGVITVGRDDEVIEAELETAASIVAEHDGRGDGRITTAVMPHAVNTVDPDTLARLADIARDNDVPVHIHCAETADDVETVRDRDGASPVETLAEAGVLDGPAFVAHGVHLDDSALEAMAATDTGIAHCPTANLKLASGIAPIEAAVTAGVPVGIGTDGPASNNDLDMLEELRLAALLAKVEADDAAVLAAETAIHLATAGGAAMLGLDTGHIAPGAPADLAVVDLEAPHFTPPHDVRSHLVYVANRGDVRHTVCDGQVLMRDREVLVLDETSVRETATRRARAAIERAA